MNAMKNLMNLRQYCRRLPPLGLAVTASPRAHPLRWLVELLTGLCCLLAAMMTQAAPTPQFTEGGEYTRTLPVQGLPAVVEFFSFHCSACALYASRLKVPDTIRAALPPGQQLVPYHLSMMGPLGPALTRAWSVALLLGVEAQLGPALFDAAQVTRSLKTPADIRQVFITQGVSAAQYDTILNSEAARMLSRKQDDAARRLQIVSAPTFVVEGRYRVINGALAEGITQEADYAPRFSALVNDLLRRQSAR
jgi:thiol:disulfide interchange protein DsbA